MYELIKGNRGNILLEGILYCFLIFFAMLINIELIKRIWISTTLHYGAFDWLRTKALGGGTSRAEKRLSNWYISAWPLNAGVKMLSHTDRIFDSVVESSRADLRSTFFLRYPSLLPLPVLNYTKHHFEVTEKCYFPYLP